MHPSNVGFLATAVYEGYYVLNSCRLHIFPTTFHETAVYFY